MQHSFARTSCPSYKPGILFVKFNGKAEAPAAHLAGTCWA